MKLGSEKRQLGAEKRQVETDDSIFWKPLILCMWSCIVLSW